METWYLKLWLGVLGSGSLNCVSSSVSKGMQNRHMWCNRSLPVDITDIVSAGNNSIFLDNVSMYTIINLKAMASGGAPMVSIAMRCIGFNSGNHESGSPYNLVLS